MKNPASIHSDKITSSLSSAQWFRIQSGCYWRLLPLHLPRRVWSSEPTLLFLWTQSASSVEVWIIPQMLAVSKTHWSSKVSGPAEEVWWQRFDQCYVQINTSISYFVLEALWIAIVRSLLQLLHTAVVHAVESQGVFLTEVKILSDNVVELWDFGGYRGNGVILIEWEWPVVHDGLIVIRRVLIGDEVIVVFVEVMPKSCHVGIPTLSSLCN